jgi:glycosyltransferase involved in cell wall biosynthesis
MRRQELVALFGIDQAEVTVIPNGIDLTAFYKLEPLTRTLVETLDLFSAAPLLLLPVRVTRRKNIEQAIRITGALRQKMPTAALVVTGPPGAHNPANAVYFDELKQLRHELGLDDAVHLLAEKVDTTLSDQVIADFYRLADALILPSREEGFGIPVLEAGLSALPIFCANIAPLLTLAGGRAGLFSPDAAPADVAAMIAQRLGDDPVVHMKIETRQEYSWEGVYEQHIQPIIETAGRHTP